MPIDPKTDFTKWTNHGNTYSEPEWKENPVVSYDGMGLMTFKGVLQGKDTHDLADLEAFGVPMFGQELKAGGKGFYVSKITKKLQANGTALFDVEAIGIEPRCNEVTAIAAEGMCSSSTEPIETHWNFENIGGTPDAPLNGATFDDKKRFTGFAVVKQPVGGPPDQSLTSSEPMAGVRSYYAAKQVFRGYFHCTAKMYPVSELNRLMSNPRTDTGEISGVRLIPRWMGVGQSGSIGSWLLLSITPEPVVSNTDGDPVILKVSFELLKARTTWNSLIYISGQS